MSRRKFSYKGEGKTNAVAASHSFHLVEARFDESICRYRYRLAPSSRSWQNIRVEESDCVLVVRKGANFLEELQNWWNRLHLLKVQLSMPQSFRS